MNPTVKQIMAGAILLLVWPVTFAPAAELQVPRWQPRDFEFQCPNSPANPFLVTFSARVKRPDGSQFTIPGFFDGGGSYKIRLSPDAEGSWSLVTVSDLPGLSGHEVRFECTRNPQPGVHGGLKVDPQHPFHFIYEDGTRWFPMGYECDWLWAMDSADPNLPTINPFLDKLAACGFNFIILDTYAHDTSWRKGKTGPDDYGPPPLYAWSGSNEKPDFTRFNLAFWQHYDRVIDAMNRRQIAAHILIKVYNKMVNWPAPGSPEDDRFFRWVIARYAAYPNVIWDFSKEANNEKNLEYKIGRLRFIRQNDPYGRLLTIHDDKKAVESGAYDSLCDFRTAQQHSNWYQVALADRERRAWPVINVEFGYEPGPGGLMDRTYVDTQPVEEVVRRAWEVSMAGAYTAYYYTYTAWDIIRPQDTPPGYAMFKHLRDFFEQTRYWLMQPAEGITSEGWCLANPGKEYAVFLNKAEPFTLRLSGLTDKLSARWYDPLTGKYQDAGQMKNGLNALTPPAGSNGMIALHVSKK